MTNLPDNCTQADIDRAFGSPSPEMERIIEAVESDHAKIAKIMATLKSVLDECEPYCHRLNIAYRQAHDDLGKIDGPLSNEALSMTLTIHDYAFGIEDGETAYFAAMDEFSSLEHAIEDAQEREEDER